MQRYFDGPLINNYFKRVIKTAVIVVLVFITFRALWSAGRFLFGG